MYNEIELIRVKIIDTQMTTKPRNIFTHDDEYPVITQPFTARLGWTTFISRSKHRLIVRSMADRMETTVGGTEISIANCSHSQNIPWLVKVSYLARWPVEPDKGRLSIPCFGMTPSMKLSRLCLGFRSSPCDRSIGDRTVGAGTMFMRETYVNGRVSGKRSQAEG